MRLPRLKTLTTRISRAALAFDAWVNASLYEGGHSTTEAYERFQARMQVFSVRGWKRYALDLTSEGVTIGTAGALLLLFLAQPAFNLTSDNWLKAQDLAVTFLDRYGTEVGRRGIKHDDSLKFDDFPELMIKALLSTEDRRFYEHWGIDPIGTSRALVSNSSGKGNVQGGSTLTQQLAKNLFLTNERSLERKVNEAFLAFWLEAHLTKNQILKLYLDRAYMGGGTFGAVAAADYYFGKRLQDITLAEAAMLAGLFKAPTKYSPNVNLPAARGRAVDVLHNMVEAGFVTEGQIQTALRNPATPVTRTKDITADYYLDWAFNEVKRMADAGKLRNDRVLTVKTPLDLSIQRSADQAVENMLRRLGDQYDVDEAGVVILDPDGALRAMVGGADYGESQFNRATDALRQPGSSFKPYVYAAALASGLFKPDTQVVDSPVCVGNWCPQNYGRSYSGRQPMWLAVAKSVNTIPINGHHGHRQGARHHPRLEGGEGRAREDHSARESDGRDDAADRHALAADRRHRGDGDGPGGRLCRVRQRGQGRQALRRQRGAQFQRRGDLPPRRREAGAGAVVPGDGRHELHAQQGRRGRHRAKGPDRGREGRGQDRHDQRLPRCVVRRLHRQLCRRRLVR
ncbi:hypothetical protein M2437_000796 [Methylorubrum pseudosasae]|nr:hypothetical protein [Methylorubrum pseudosasae]